MKQSGCADHGNEFDVILLQYIFDRIHCRGKSKIISYIIETSEIVSRCHEYEKSKDEPFALIIYSLYHKGCGDERKECEYRKIVIVSEKPLKDFDNVSESGLVTDISVLSRYTQ